MKSVAIFRSRFSPLSKLHLEAIKWYFNIQKENTLPDNLLLCIVKDYESLIRTHAHRLNKNIKPTDLRHLRVFNPLSLWDITVDLAKLVSPLEANGDNKIIFLPSILKCNDLVNSILKDGRYIPEDFEVYTKWIDTIKKCEKLELKKCKIVKEIHRTLGAWWGLATYDLMPYPEVEEIYWFLPIFDFEDFKDWEMLINKFGPDKVIGLPMMDLAKFAIPLPPNSEISIRSVGIYGLFVYHIFAKVNKLTNIVPKIEAAIRKQIPNKYMTEKYFDRLGRGLQTTLTKEEKNLLNNPAQFSQLCEKSIKALVDSAMKKSIREKYAARFEVDLLNKAEKRIKYCTVLRTGEVDSTKYTPVDRYEQVLVRIRDKMVGREITYTELIMKDKRFMQFMDLEAEEIYAGLELINELDRKV